jgi:hypothetical protein
MSTWETIESEVVQTLAGLMSGPSALLVTVKGRSIRSSKALITELQRERLPAAYVVVTGRDASDKAFRRAGSPMLSVFLAARSLRHEDDARTGAADVEGVFSLSEEASAALAALTIGQDRRLLLADERATVGEDGLNVWEQRYEIRRLSELTAPTFGGVPLAGADSEVHVEVGPLQRASSTFSFPGIDGVFSRHLGTRDRAIRWRGQLRADDDGGLNALEAAIEDALRDGTSQTMVDAWGRPHDACVLNAFDRRGPRQRDALTGQALQDFEIVFTQMDG